MTEAASSLEPSVSLLPTPAGYLQRSTLPLPSLVLLLPLIFLYEVGTGYFTTAARNGKDQQIIAFSKMQQFFRMFGANGRHMPAIAVVGILLAWHVLRSDTWKIEFRTIFGMIAESIALGLPLLFLAFVVNRYFPLIGLHANSGAILSGRSPLQDRLIMDLGAGVYEEFVFRFVLFTFLSTVFKDMLKFEEKTTYLLMVVVSGLSFSVYHYWSPTEQFIFRIFAFRALAGAYFGIIFMFRGFGVTAGSHCAYDVIITLC